MEPGRPIRMCTVSVSLDRVPIKCSSTPTLYKQTTDTSGV